MTKKLIILFVAIGVTCICRAQGRNQSVVPFRETPAAAFSAQSPPAFAFRTNLLYWASIVPNVTPNLGIEFGLSKKMTLNLSGGFNPWDDNKPTTNKKFKHWIVEPELRYWFCERFNGSALGLHAIMSGVPFTDIKGYNIGGYDIPLLFEKAYRYEGTAIGGGISYIYHWMVGKHFGLEFNVGAGFAYLKYDKFPCPKCSPAIGKFSKTYIGPTKLGINLIFVIK